MNENLMKQLDLIKKPYKIYADVLEDPAMEQFTHCMSQDNVIQGALMADAHTGYVAPIGSVLAVDNAVYPAFVGYDIGCTDKDTEYLSQSGWKKISEYDPLDLVMGYDKLTGTSKLETPIRYVVNKNVTKFFHLDNGVVDQMITPDHKMLLFGCNNDKPVSILADDAIAKNKKLSKGISDKIKTTIPNLNTNASVDYNPEEIRLLIAIVADGRIRGNRIEFHIKKERKIKRLKELLKDNNIKLSEHKRTNGNFSCSFTWKKATKSLSILWNASKAQLKTAADESIFWDGHHRENGQRIFYSTNKESIDVIQYAFAVNGIRTNYYKTEYDNDWADSYQLYTTSNANILFPKEKDIKIINHKEEDEVNSYCFTMPTGYWIMRRNGKIAITGNCGLISAELDVRVDELDLESLKQSILRSIPIGFNKHNRQREIPKDLRDMDRTDVATKFMNEAGYNQIGTLGGGKDYCFQAQR